MNMEHTICCKQQTAALITDGKIGGLSIELSICHVCMAIYRKDLKSDTSMVWFRDGATTAIRSDKEWERTRLLVQLNDQDKETLKGLLKQAETMGLTVKARPTFFLPLIRRIYTKLLEQAGRDALPLINLNNIYLQLNYAEYSGRFKSKGKRDVEAEVIAELCDEYVSGLMENCGTT